MVAHGTPCLGPVTHAGCGALCPAYDRGCYGCYGPMETPNTASLRSRLAALGADERDAATGVYRTFNADAEPFRQESRAPWRVRRIKVDYLARVEGEGALTSSCATAAVKSAELRIFEPPRFFEAFLRGRAFSEAPDITARICGICPVAYQMSAVHAMEDALGVAVDGAAPRSPPAPLLRRMDREPRPPRLYAARPRFPRLRGRASRWRRITATSSSAASR